MLLIGQSEAMRSPEITESRKSMEPPEAIGLPEPSDSPESLKAPEPRGAHGVVGTGRARIEHTLRRTPQGLETHILEAPKRAAINCANRLRGRMERLSQ